MYIINYGPIGDRSFDTDKSLKRYLEGELREWGGLLNALENAKFSAVPFSSGGKDTQYLRNALNIMIDSTEDIRRFNHLTQHRRNGVFPPPPADSLEGKLILALIDSDKKDEAISVYIWYLNACSGIQNSGRDFFSEKIAEGNTLVLAAYACEVLPFHKVTSQKIAGAHRRMTAKLEELEGEVSRAREMVDQEQGLLAEMRQSLKDRAKRIERIFFKKEGLRKTRHSHWMRGIDAETNERFTNAEKRLAAVDRLNTKRQSERDLEFERLKELFYTQLRLKAPVALWEGRARMHEQKSRNSFNYFAILTFFTIIIAISLPYYGGDYIARSFVTQVCNPVVPAECSVQFSAKGPLTVAGLLLMMSLFMWAIRLQYRIHLSERHLALDASEKQAFAETFLAMKEGEEVGADNEAIVLAALFRPTQDGIIKDDESAVDLSAAAILAKQLGRP